MFTQSNYAIYILDNYSVLITDEVRKGYILMVIDGGITGDVQCNITHVHYFLKQKYWMLEAELTIEMLRKDSNKIPSPSLDEIMKLLSEYSKSLHVDVEEALKQNPLTDL